jgi:hypothetical protein
LVQRGNGGGKVSEAELDGIAETTWITFYQNMLEAARRLIGGAARVGEKEERGRATARSFPLCPPLASNHHIDVPAAAAGTN